MYSNICTTRVNILACYTFHLDVINLLNKTTCLIIAPATGINVRDEFGRTPLHWSCEKGHMEVVSFLMEHGADVRLQDGCGRPPLEWATRAGHLNMVRFLVKNGASVKTLNSDGKTSLHLASQKGYTEVNMAKNDKISKGNGLFMLHQ